MLVLLVPLKVNAETYGKCHMCDGTAVCELCDPSRAADRLGNGYLVCIYCHQTGYITCGTNHTGDGTPIGCDGSGIMPDGTVCVVCGGAGKYPCDVCYGSGVFDCKCRQMGQPGVCLGCFGTGWRLLNSQGQGINTSPVYPTDGSTISFVEWGRDERHTYDASRYGNGTSPGQYMQIYSGGGSAQGSGQNNGPGGDGQNNGPDGGGQNNGPNGDGQNNGDPDHPQNGDQDAHHDGPEPDGHDEQNNADQIADADFYRVQILSDEETVRQISSDDDMIYFICTEVDNGYLFSVQAVKSMMSPGELEILYRMTADDIADFKQRLQTAAEGMKITGITTGDDGFRVSFESGPMDLFPFTCDVLLEIPIDPRHEPADLYNIYDGRTYKCSVRAEDAVWDHEYLIFGCDRLGSFVLSTMPEEYEQGPMPAENRNTYEHAGDDSGHQQPPGSDQSVDSVPDAGSHQDAAQPENTSVQNENPNQGPGNGLSIPMIILIAVLVAAAGACIGIFFYKKKR